MVTMRQVSLMRGRAHVLSDIDWTIAGGEHWVIAGANGSGKTALLELLAGVVHPTRGNVTFHFLNGTTWDERHTERRKHIYYVPAHAIQTFLAGHEVFYQQRYYTIGDERVPAVRELLHAELDGMRALNIPASFNITALLDLPVTRLSNGQLKKLLILQHLARGIPKLMLFDYPFEGLDGGSRDDLSALLNHLAQNFQVSIVLTDHEHNLPAAINRRLLLVNGGVAAAGPWHSHHVGAATPPAKADATAAEPVVEMKGISIRYGTRTIIRDLYWTVRRGERWALTGRNGSGKTTLFSLIYADHPLAYSEPVYLFGKRRGSGESIWDIKRRINYFGPELINYLQPQRLTQTARAYLLQFADTGQLEAAIDFFAVGAWVDRPVQQLSSGQLQVMLVMRSLLSGKELLLLDEPYQFLDSEQKLRLTNYIHAHLHADTTLVLITHYERDIHYWTQHHLHLP